ncbi:hypothetical protein, partial [Lysinibacillus sp. NPDC093688]|uniref:hypothetical protein n=1 Tax=Lysinibacillus sp. NPDC093688 TaxID=3390577 RepID=UPI003D0326E0
LPLTLRFRAEQSFLGASDEPLRFAAGSRANTRLVTKALSQDVMDLAFVPLSLIPEESPSLHSNQLIYRAYVNYQNINKYNKLVLHAPNLKIVFV